MARYGKSFKDRVVGDKGTGLFSGSERSNRKMSLVCHSGIPHSIQNVHVLDSGEGGTTVREQAAWTSS